MKEIWLTCAVNSNYEVSSFGSIRNAQNKILLHPFITPKGYLRIRLNKKGYFVHRLVVLTFIGDIPNGLEVNHENLIKTDNWVGNLKIMTGKENKEHAALHGRSKGENNSQAKLDSDKVRTIKRLIRTGVILNDIAEMFHVAHSTIGSISCGKSWSHIK